MAEELKPCPPEALEAAKSDFEAALSAMPFGTERIASGQQFNAYESAASDDDDDPGDWDFYLSLGPIDNRVHILDIGSEWRAKLIEAALRVAMRSRNVSLPTPTEGAEIVRKLSQMSRVRGMWTDADREYAARAATHITIQEAELTRLRQRVAELEGRLEMMLCEDCPPVGYPTDKTRCDACPRVLTHQPDGDGAS